MMNTVLLPDFPNGRLSILARSFALRTIQFASAAQPRVMPGWPAAATFAALSAAWSVNSMDWGFVEAQAMVAVCAWGFVATVALAVGWASEPEELQKWVLRAFAATSMSVLPLLT